MRQLLDITWHRNVSKGGYGMVAQLRSWLPNSIGGVYWLYLDNQYMSTYVPIHAGVQEISPHFQTYDYRQYSEDSARWVIDFVDNLLYLRFRDAMEDVRAARDPLEASFFAEQQEIEEKALELYGQSPQEAEAFLTELARSRTEKVVDLYRKLRVKLITTYTNNREWL